MADLIQIGIDVNSNADQATKGLDRLQGSVVNNLKAAERLERNYKVLDRAMNKGKITAQMYARGVQQVDAAIDEVINGTQRATKVTNQYANATRAAAGAMNQYGKASVIGGKNLNRTNMMIQQSGYQFQDFAVQVQGGTNAFVALGQQGSQLLGIFGPTGAVLGAFLAVGTAIARMKTDGSNLSFDFKRFGQDVAKSLEPLKPIFNALGSAISAVASVFSTVANTIVQNLDRVAAYALVVATAVGAKLVKGFVAARIATMSWAASFALLRKAIIRTGIGALVVLAGELVLAFSNVSTTLGGVGKAFTLFGAVGLEILKRLRTSVEFLYYKWMEASSSADVWILSSLRDIMGYFGDTFNKIGAFVVGTIEGIKSVFDVLPEFVGNIGKSAANLFVGGMESLANGAISAVNKVIAAFNDVVSFLGADKAAQFFGFSGEVPTISDADLSSYKMELAAQGQSLSEAFNTGFSEGVSKSDQATPVADFLNRAIADAKTMQDLYESLSTNAAKALTAPMPQLQALLDAIKGGSASVGDLASYFSLVDDEANEAATSMNDFVKEMREQVRQEGELIGLSKDATREKKIYFELLNENAKNENVYSKDRLRAIAKEIAAQKKANAAFEKLIDITDELSDAFGDYVASGLKDFKGFTDTIKSMFKKLLSDMAAAAVRNKILIPIATGMGAGFGSSAAASTIGAGTGSFAAGTIGASFAAGSTALTAGISTTLGIGTSTTGATAMAMSPTMASIGAAIPYIVAIAAVIGLLTKKTKLLDSGLRTTIEGFDVAIETFKLTQSSRLFGLLKGSKKLGYEAASAEVADPLIEAIGNMQQSIVDAAGTLGIGASAFDDFSYQFKLSLKGLTEEEQLQKINEEINKMGDSFASLTGHFETMNELLEAANQRMQLQNRLDQLLGNNQAILTRQREAELLAMHELNRPLAQMIYNLEDAQASVQSAFASLGASIEAEKNRLRDAFTSIVDGLNKRLDVANETMARSNSIYSMLESAVSGRSITSGIGQSLSRREGALGFIRGGDFSDERKLEEALDVVAEPSEGLFSSFVDYARDFSRTSITLEEAKKVAQVQLTADEKSVLLLEEQIAQAQVDLDAQLEALDKQYQMQVDQYNALLGIDTNVKSVEEAIGTLRSAIEALASAQAAAKAAAAVGTAGAGAGTGAAAAGIKLTGEKYQGYDLGNIRGAADLMAAAAQNNIQTSGQTGAQIQQALSNATGLAINMDNATRGKQFAMGGYHTGGLRMVGERGPELEATGPSRIFSHNQTSGMFKDPDLKEAVNELRREVSGLRSEQRQMQASNAKYVKRNYDINRKWDVDGLPATRT